MCKNLKFCMYILFMSTAAHVLHYNYYVKLGVVALKLHQKAYRVYFLKKCATTTAILKAISKEESSAWLRGVSDKLESYAVKHYPTSQTRILWVKRKYNYYLSLRCWSDIFYAIYVCILNENSWNAIFYYFSYFLFIDNQICK